MELEPIRIAITEILQIELINTKFFFFSLWSVIHVLSGFLFMYLIKDFKLTKTNKIIILSLILVFYEIIEFWAIGTFPNFFLPETLIDAISDVAVGVIGGLIYLWKK